MKKPKRMLTNDEKRIVRKWLEMGIYELCPFSDQGENPKKIGEKICRSWFPRSRCHPGHSESCPCRRYALKTVIRRVKEMIE